MAIPANYKVPFMQGGAIGENAIVPMNLLRGKDRADYIHTGEWSKKSIAEAKRYCKVNVAASAESSGLLGAARELEARRRCRLRAHLRQRDDRRRRIPLHARHRAVPPVADMSSNILAPGRRRPLRIYGGAQKNIDPPASR
jgi:phosphoserine aminotransferase